MTIELSTEEYKKLITKAYKWDALSAAMSELYHQFEADCNDEGLDQVGELAATHLGFM